MVRPVPLTEIGYWRGGESSPDWPDPREFVDASWDPEEREMVARYLECGQVVVAYMGFSTCRLCDRENGNLDLSDGKYIWPSGFAHYVEEHGIRPPQTFVQHVERVLDELETAPRDASWWKGLSQQEDS